MLLSIMRENRLLLDHPFWSTTNNTTAAIEKAHSARFSPKAHIFWMPSQTKLRHYCLSQPSDYAAHWRVRNQQKLNTPPTHQSTRRTHTEKRSPNSDALFLQCLPQHGGFSAKAEIAPVTRHTSRTPPAYSAITWPHLEGQNYSSKKHPRGREHPCFSHAATLNAFKHRVMGHLYFLVSPLHSPSQEIFEPA